MKKLNIILNSLLILLSNSYPLNETKITLKKNYFQNENYINIIEIRDFFLKDECGISSPNITFIIFINQANKEIALNLNGLFKLENTKNKNNVNLNCNSKEGDDKLYCDFNKKIIFESEEKYKLKDINEEVIFNCSKVNSNKIEKCILLPFKTNFEIGFNKLFDMIPEPHNITYLVDFRKNESIKFKIDFDDFILSDKPQLFINGKKLNCDIIENINRKEFGNGVNCYISKNDINYNYATKFPIIINKCGKEEIMNINIVFLNNRKFINPFFPVFWLFIFYSFLI